MTSIARPFRYICRLFIYAYYLRVKIISVSFEIIIAIFCAHTNFQVSVQKREKLETRERKREYGCCILRTYAGCTKKENRGSFIRKSLPVWSTSSEVIFVLGWEKLIRLYISDRISFGVIWRFVQSAPWKHRKYFSMWRNRKNSCELKRKINSKFWTKIFSEKLNTVIYNYYN